MNYSLKERLNTTCNDTLGKVYKNSIDICDIEIERNTLNSNVSNKSTKDPSQIRKARIYQVLGIVLWAISGIFIKIVIEKYSTDLPFYVYLSLRFFLLSLICLMNMKYHNLLIEKLTNFYNHKWMTIRIVSFIISFWAYPMSMRYLKFGLATLITVTSPIFQNILYSFYYSLKLNMKYIYSCLVCLFGVFIIFTQSKDMETEDKSGDIKEDNTILGIILSLTNAILIAVYYLSVRVLNQHMSIYNINYITGFWSGLICLVLVILLDTSTITYFFNIEFLFYLILISVFGYYGFHFVNLAIITADISKSSYIMYLQLPMHALFGIIFYKEVYNIFESIGIFIILSANLYTSIYVT